LRRRLQKIELKRNNCSRTARYTPLDLQSKKLDRDKRILLKRESLNPKARKSFARRLAKRHEFVKRKKEFAERLES